MFPLRSKMFPGALFREEQVEHRCGHNHALADSLSQHGEGIPKCGELGSQSTRTYTYNHIYMYAYWHVVLYGTTAARVLTSAPALSDVCAVPGRGPDRKPLKLQ